ncbi:hypothetical protein AURANDRAFT_69180 [Aureococcus anophagefferens]|uniref:Uncharacterized protein n=1 Tax=Aureococcus anophagefferens TaxID=44056 RepID=F0YRZ0_AURAN|nr:hypothetical protein AURANDRAFT_69180 [Aureococcus anophagefferens]EGB02119.1 hypothetical protein AURANDRAFT_69180 [Aureococcus anophagefferens]|eukprot:XP_009043182.1 hypothetical protein AURANDRAFT_69180 [Aureococcus anophagefferens]
MSVLAAADAGALVAERAAPPAAAADDVASATLAAQARVVDALSYVEPYAAAAAAALVEAELARGGAAPPASPALAVAAPVWPRSAVLEAELARAASGADLAPLEVSRYACDAPPDGSGAAAWRAAADNAAAQLGHQANRVVNLELAEAFGEAAWRRHAADLAAARDALRASARGARAAAERVNAARRADQERLAPEILRAERRCAARLEARGALEAEVAGLRARVAAGDARAGA